VAEWWSIEVLHGEVSAFRWQEQHDSALIEAALTNGVRDGAWHADRWGVVFEVLFDTDEQWEAFRSLPVVRAALDAVPDPVNGLLIYRGRGGGAGAREPRRLTPAPAIIECSCTSGWRRIGDCQQTRNREASDCFTTRFSTRIPAQSAICSSTPTSSSA
jgi:hypothetical protein